MFDNSKSKSVVRLVRAEKMVLSGLVFARKIARMILTQNIQGLIGPLMIHMAFMPLYMWEMWDVTPLTAHGRTVESSAVFSLSWIRKYQIGVLNLNVINQRVAWQAVKIREDISSTNDNFCQVSTLQCGCKATKLKVENLFFRPWAVWDGNRADANNVPKKITQDIDVWWQNLFLEQVQKYSTTLKTSGNLLVNTEELKTTFDKISFAKAWGSNNECCDGTGAKYMYKMNFWDGE